MKSGGHIFILTGAGVSKESGLDTFRDKGGIWAKYKIENVATPEGFDRNPALVHEFYNGRRQQLQDPKVQPNPAHHAIAKLMKEWNGDVTLVTQNIDNLHNRAAAALDLPDGIIQMHGRLLESLCTKCGVVEEINHDLNTDMVCHKCGTKGSVRPNIVWFGEMPYAMDEIYTRLADCDLFISIGTSGTVYPAAGFVAEAKAHGCIRAMEVNLERSDSSYYFDEYIIGPASETVPQLVEKILTGK
ncbi:MAG: NAD-dependent deacylase [Alphaproteobacteria bacterium]|nr:MAG: NAD-dependent deacylase [Alphaproteobacteria bacterium]